MAPLRARRDGVGARRRRARPGGAAPQAEKSGRSRPAKRRRAATPDAARVVTCSLFALAQGWGLGSRCLPVGSRRRLHAVGAGSSALMRAPQSWGAERGQGARRSPHAGSGPSERVRLRCSQGVRKGAEIPPEMLQSPRAAEGGARGLGRGSSPARGPGARIREEASGAAL